MKLFPNLVVSKLFSQGVSGQLKKVVETSFVVPNEGFHLPPLFLPLVAVASHVIQLLEPCLNAMLGAVPLAAYLLHYRQTETDAYAMEREGVTLLKKKKKTSTLLSLKQLMCFVFFSLRHLFLKLFNGC